MIGERLKSLLLLLPMVAAAVFAGLSLAFVGALFQRSDFFYRFRGSYPLESAPKEIRLRLPRAGYNVYVTKDPWSYVDPKSSDFRVEVYRGDELIRDSAAQDFLSFSSPGEAEEFRIVFRGGEEPAAPPLYLYIHYNGSF